ncbi:FabD/lysophospholipase-like protein [Patellaria atrata CBS 101060]|uniref:FabD/lysophospholipase-like protein n=1 Tax=Patellaria atrata CBS 101060 TaxID=1346257 RepID=A0A9P4S3W2_9PEZI|nr:FabD/lysophospholipase-like protein [Patellaria atrata CBS 101060]
MPSSTTTKNEPARAIIKALPNESNPRAPLRLLSLDGGGVRGLSSLMILATLMENIAAEEKRLKKRPQGDNTPLKPCDYFDLIGGLYTLIVNTRTLLMIIGTSTGGIIAVLLGRLKLDCQQCIAIYIKLAKQIFEKDRSIHVAGWKIPLGATRFSGAVLENAIKTALKELGYDENELMWDGTLFEEAMTEGKNDSIWHDSIPTIITQSPIDNHSIRQRATFPEDTDSLFRKHSFKSMRSNRGDVPGYGTLANQAPSRSSKTFERPPTWRIHPRSSVRVKVDQKGCRTFVVSSLKNALGLPRILSTYDPNDRITTIWQALRATSAAPTFFEEMTFGTPRVTYLDGGVGFNNPTAELDYAAKSIWPGRAIGAIVSVGTGLQTIPSVGKVRAWLPFGLSSNIALASALANMATSTARVDNEMQRMYYNSSTTYFRFDVDGGLADISLEKWMMDNEMASLTRQYMSDPQQLHRAHALGELICKLSALPPEFAIPAKDFRYGVDGRALQTGAFQLDQIDFKTGFPMGVQPSPQDVTPEKRAEARENSPSGQAGTDLDQKGRLRKIFPVTVDLDHDGHRDEAVVATCSGADNICLRVLRTGIPQGVYRVRFIACFFTPPGSQTNSADVVFSVGRPFDARTFTSRFVDVKITPDVVPVLLHPDAVRVRVGEERYEEVKGRGWVELVGDVNVEVGLEGEMGIVVNKKWERGMFVGGWSFGGVKLQPVFDTPMPVSP